MTDLILRFYTFLHANEDGADMAEYALVLVLIAIVAFAAVQGVGTEVTCAFNKIVAGLQNTTPAC
ncbi:MAG: Flp family type IVb pilin [Anaerolineae bacterium]